MSSSSRAERLAALLGERGIDQLLVGDLVRPGDSTPDAIANLRWLTGFSGTSGLAIVGAEDRVFLTDFRYVQRAQREVAPEFEQAMPERELLAGAVKRLHGRVGYDDAQTSVKNLRKLEQLVPEGVELVAAGGLVERLRRRKDAGELRTIAEAARLADQVYEWVFDRGVVGRTEREIMLDAHQRMRELGADDPSFPAIVAAGENSALPHHSSSEREVRAGELLLIDMGAAVDGYCSDCTRTVAVGEIDDDASEVYELVRSAQAMALEAIRAGWMPATPTPWPGIQSPRRATASTSATDSGTGWGSRSTRHHACRSSRIRHSRLATWSRWSRASTCRAASASGSRTW